ncbi:hypothetical protein DFP72DRAFT_495621 [Ephemerocybe angulata]|uniref:F-box domain-containing protein n=1 Tax=Ephemerocybe angulata TaxID=980116 RepID=A0A8H6HRA7_9AGAR|nr:hypothetical protein DFP72DRAFT_495621 [Tulosesus angulatus]
MSTQVPRYAHGAPLPTILEEGEIGASATFDSLSQPGLDGYPDACLAISGEAHPALVGRPETMITKFPAELLLKIFLDTLDRHRKGPRSTTKAGAINLLHLSHTSSRFRKLVINDPSLWAMVPFLNGVHPDFLLAILSRSQPLTFELAFREDETLLGEDRAWDQIVLNFRRVSRLHVEISEAHEGAKTKSLLYLDSPSLTHCTVYCMGAHAKQLNHSTPHILPFRNSAPLLRGIDLINCYLPIGRYLPSLSSFIICNAADSDVAPSIPISDLLQWGQSFASLTKLTLSNCIQPFVDLEAMYHLGPIPLPSLDFFFLEASPECCRQLGRIIRLRSTCSRSITVITSPDYYSNLADAATFAESVLSFIPTDLVYMECVLGMGDGYLTVRLVKTEGRRLAMSIRFNTDNLNVSLSIPSHHLLALHPITEKDLFLYQICHFLTTSLQPILPSISGAHLWFDHDSVAPHVFRNLLKAMQNVEVVTTRSSRTWANPLLLGLLSQDNVPGLKKIRVPFDEMLGPTTVQRLNGFLCSRGEVKEVAFSFQAEDTSLCPTVLEMWRKVDEIIKNLPDSVLFYCVSS